MPLLDPSHFEKLFVPLRGRKICFVPLDGNVGDLLNHRSTYQLFDHFGVHYRVIAPRDVDVGSISGEFDEVVVSGGGNMGGAFYRAPFETRQELIKTGLPITIFPQSFIENVEDLTPYKKVYVREESSLELNSGVELAPDLALGYAGPFDYPGPEEKTGVFLRRDAEQKFAGAAPSLGDPVELSRTVEEYLDLASRFEHIVTDRLHFAISALLLGRRATLLPNSYFKNSAFHRTWLSDLCEWRDDLADLAFDSLPLGSSLFRRLAGPPSAMIDWSGVPVRRRGFFLDRREGGMHLVHADGSQHIDCNETSAMVWQLSNGDNTVDDIVNLLVDAYPEHELEVIRGVQRAVRRFVSQGAIVIDGGQAEAAVRSDADGPESVERKGPGVMIRSPVFDLVVREPQLEEGKYRCSAQFGGRELWFAVDRGLRDAVTTKADPFLLGCLMLAMKSGFPVRVTGAPVSPGLLRNLDEFQRAWCCWREKLSVVDIEAEESAGRSDRRESSLACFSGGVDSCYTIYSHLIQPDRRWRRRIDAALLIRGFDFGYDNQEKFEQCYRNAANLLDGLPVELVSVQTNLKDYSFNWLDNHGLVLAANLTLFCEGYSAGVVGATLPYVVLQPLGSNPTTDWLMGSEDFDIVHHGAATSRLEKIRAISQWPAVLEHLRVCWRNQSAERLNCGACLSCVLASILFQCVGVQPSCLPANIRAEDITGLVDKTNLGRLEWYDMRCILAEVDRRGLQTPWADALREIVVWHAAFRGPAS